MMDRNREARRAAAMTNGLPRRRHRTTTTGGSLRESPEDEGPVELQETAARLRDRTAKKDRDREMRERERERDRLNRSKRRRGDKYDGVGGGGGGGDDGSSEDSVNDEEDDDEEAGGGGGGVRYVPPSSNNPVLVSSTSAASSTLTHRKSYPPPNKVFRVAPTWKAPDEMIGVSIPRKARSASTKRGHDWSTAAAGEQVNNTSRQASPSPGRSTTGVAQSQSQAIPPSPLQAPPPPPPPSRPMSPSPSSSNVSIKKKIKANGPKHQHHHHHHQQQRPPKSTSKTPTTSPSVQDEIEIEVAEVLYGLMRQSQAPPPSKQEGGTGVSPNDSTKLDFRSNNNHDSKSRVSSPAPNSSSHHHINHHHSTNNNPSTSSSSTPLTTVAPKRKRPRPYPEDNPSNLGHRSNPKVETDQTPKVEAASPMTEKKNSEENGGEMVNSQEVEAEAAASTTAGAISNVIQSSDAKVGDESSRNGMMLRAKVEETSSSPKLESSHNQTSVHDRVESSTTSIKPKSSHVEQENHREDKLEIDLMAPPPQSRGSPEEAAEYGGDEKCMVTEREAEAKPTTKPKDEVVDEKGKFRSAVSVGGPDLKAVECDPPKQQPLSSLSLQPELNLNGKDERRSIDLQFDLEKSGVNEEKLNFQKPATQAVPPSKTTRDDANTDNKHGGQSSSGQLPMSVPGGWHGGLPPMGYVGPLQGVVSMDGTPLASPPIQHPTPHFLFSQPKQKRCATHFYIASSISVHQQMMKMNPFWPAAAAAAAGTGPPLFGGKPYNLNMVPPADLHVAAAGRGVVVSSSQDSKGQPFTFFPGQPASSKDNKSPQPSSNAPDSAQKKFLLQPALPPGAPSNLLHGPALFFPMGGQQQPAVASARPSTTKSPSTTGAASASASTSAPMSAVASNGGPAMSFSYPNMGGNETQFMAILGNSPYPFPIPAHVGAGPPYRGAQALPYFNGTFYSSQMLHHPSQLQQQQAVQQQSQSMQLQHQPNASISTASSSSQKQLQNMQQQRPQGNSGNPNQSLQNFQVNKGRASQPHHEMGGEDSPSTADSRTRANMSVYGQNFAMPPFNVANFAMPTSMGSNAAGVPNGNSGDKKQQQPPQQTPAFPMSFATINGTTPALDISSIANNHALLQSLPEGARQNYQLMAAVQAQQNKKNSCRGPDDGKSGVAAATDPSNIDDERKALAARASASVAQSIAFSRDLSDNSMAGNNVVDTSARSLNLIHGSSTRPNRSSSQNTMSNSNASSNSQQQQQQQQQQHQMLFKQQQYGGSTAPSGRSKTPSTSNGNVYPDHLASPSVMSKFPNNLSGFPPLLQQTSGAPVQSSQWKNSGRPNTAQGSSPTLATSNASNMKHLPQQQGRSQQSHTQISFGVAGANPKVSSAAQGQQAQNNNQAPSSPMIVGSPSTSSVSKGASGSPRNAASASTGNKQGGQVSALSSQQGKNSQSPSLGSQKQSILGSPHHLMSNSNQGNKPQSQQSQQQPQLSRQSIQQTQLYFNNAYMQASSNTSAPMAGSGYYLQRYRPDNQQQQQQQQQLLQQQHQQQVSKSQGMGTTSSSGMLSLCTSASLNSSTSDPAKAVAAAAANMKGGMPSQGMFAAAQFAAQSAGAGHQLMPAGFPYVHTVSTAVQVKPAEQKQPAGE